MRMLGACQDMCTSKWHHLKMIMKTKYPNRHRMKIISGINCRTMLRVLPKYLGVGNTPIILPKARHVLFFPLHTASTLLASSSYAWMEKKRKEGFKRARVWKVASEAKGMPVGRAGDPATVSPAHLAYTNTFKGTKSVPLRSD